MPRTGSLEGRSAAAAAGTGSGLPRPSAPHSGAPNGVTGIHDMPVTPLESLSTRPRDPAALLREAPRSSVRVSSSTTPREIHSQLSGASGAELLLMT